MLYFFFSLSRSRSVPSSLPLSHPLCLIFIHTLVQFDERFNIYKEYKENVLSFSSSSCVSRGHRRKRIRDEGREKRRERDGQSDRVLAVYY